MTQKKKRGGKRANGDGTISKQMRDGKVVGWQAALTVGVLPNGEPDRRWLSAKTQEGVQEKLMSLRANKHTGMLADSENLDLATYMDRWLDYKSRDGIKPNTLRSYQDAVRLSSVPVLGRIRLAKLRPIDVENMLTRYTKAGKSPAWTAYKLRVLKMALKQAMRWDMVPRNVAEASKAPKQVRRKVSVWTLQESDAFLTYAKSHRLYVRHNLIEVRVDPHPGKRHAGKEAVSAVEIRLATPKTAGSQRTILLSSGTVSELRVHKERQEVERQAAGSAWEGENFVFASPLGGHTDPRTFYGWYLALLLVSGVRRIRFHDLRHTAASLMILRGVPPKTVSERLGHADVAFTLQVYTHLYDEQKEEAVFDIADLIAEDKARKAKKAEEVKQAEEVKKVEEAKKAERDDEDASEEP